MGYRIKQHNFDKPATAEQRKVLDLFGVAVGSMTRIVAHLTIREMLQQTPRLKQRLKVWRAVREQDRKRRRETHAEPR
jgi:hypothetical protein